MSRSMGEVRAGWDTARPGGVYRPGGAFRPDAQRSVPHAAARSQEAFPTPHVPIYHDPSCGFGYGSVYNPVSHEHDVGQVPCQQYRVPPPLREPATYEGFYARSYRYSPYTESPRHMMTYTENAGLLVSYQDYAPHNHAYTSYSQEYPTQPEVRAEASVPCDGTGAPTHEAEVHDEARPTPAAAGPAEGCAVTALAAVLSVCSVASATLPPKKRKRRRQKAEEPAPCDREAPESTVAAMSAALVALHAGAATEKKKRKRPKKAERQATEAPAPSAPAEAQADGQPKAKPGASPVARPDHDPQPESEPESAPSVRPANPPQQPSLTREFEQIRDEVQQQLSCLDVVYSTLSGGAKKVRFGEIDTAVIGSGDSSSGSDCDFPSLPQGAGQPVRGDPNAGKRTLYSTIADKIPTAPSSASSAKAASTGGAWGQSGRVSRILNTMRRVANVRRTREVPAESDGDTDWETVEETLEPLHPDASDEEEDDEDFPALGASAKRSVRPAAQTTRIVNLGGKWQRSLDLLKRMRGPDAAPEATAAKQPKGTKAKKTKAPPQKPEPKKPAVQQKAPPPTPKVTTPASASLKPTVTKPGTPNTPSLKPAAPGAQDTKKKEKEKKKKQEMPVVIGGKREQERIHVTMMKIKQMQNLEQKRKEEEDAARARALSRKPRKTETIDLLGFAKPKHKRALNEPAGSRPGSEQEAPPASRPLTTMRSVSAPATAKSVVQDSPREVQGAQRPGVRDSRPQGKLFPAADVPVAGAAVPEPAVQPAPASVQVEVEVPKPSPAAVNPALNEEEWPSLAPAAPKAAPRSKREPLSDSDGPAPARSRSAEVRPTSSASLMQPPSKVADGVQAAEKKAVPKPAPKAKPAKPSAEAKSKTKAASKPAPKKGPTEVDGLKIFANSKKPPRTVEPPRDVEAPKTVKLKGKAKELFEKDLLTKQGTLIVKSAKKVQKRSRVKKIILREVERERKRLQRLLAETNRLLVAAAAAAPQPRILNGGCCVTSDGRTVQLNEGIIAYAGPTDPFPAPPPRMTKRRYRKEKAKAAKQLAQQQQEQRDAEQAEQADTEADDKTHHRSLEEKQQQAEKQQLAVAVRRYLHPRNPLAHQIDTRAGPNADPFVREYVKQCLSKDLDGLVVSMMRRLKELQERLREEQPQKFKAKRRYVIGLKECLKAANLKLLKAAIVVPDVDVSRDRGGLDDILGRIVESCVRSDVPLIFAMSRRTLGVQCFGPALRNTSCIGLFSVDGDHETYSKIISAREKLQRDYDTIAADHPNLVPAALTYHLTAKEEEEVRRVESERAREKELEELRVKREERRNRVLQRSEEKKAAKLKQKADKQKKQEEGKRAKQADQAEQAPPADAG